MAYDHKKIEKKWQDYWVENKVFRAVDNFDLPKYYVLDMFPYPSGAGLHVGHPLGYIATDIIARYKRHKGFNVLHPMGWDAFGLPAEQYAIKTGTHPSVTTKNNIDNFRRQIKMLGFSYDWDREINTTDAKYVKWTQWIFLQLYKKGLAYESEVPVNWCPELKAVLANEEVVDGKSEIGGHPVFRLPMRQWMLRITDYAKSLLEGLDDLDWPDSIKELQRNWIGRSEGANVHFELPSINEKLTVFTTRPDTLFGATYMVMAPEHPLVNRLVSAEQKIAVKQYVEDASKKSDLDRTELNKEKSGVYLGAKAINPVNGKEIPIWISDYVIMSYGTGAIMAVPGQDQRDWDFAKEFDLPIIRTVEPPEDFEGEAYFGEGPAINSDFLNGLNIADAKSKIISWLEKKGLGEKATQFKLRDWLFSRQRYWGEPIPVIHNNGATTPLDESELPLELPEVEKYEPAGTGESPLSNITEWVEVKDETGNILGLRETNTMPQWAGSCWYYLRYIDPGNSDKSWDGAKEKYWMPVDLYVGGAEHAVLHLLYARFWHHVLYDLGHVSTKEPFQKLFNQGMILGQDGSKMSKSRGNVVNPDETVDTFGADSMRLYEMFMGPLDKAKPWSTTGLQGCSRFVNKLWNIMVTDSGNISVKITNDPPTKETARMLHSMIKRVSVNLDNLQFNTCVSEFMIFTNHIQTLITINNDVLKSFIILINPFMPHMAEELWQLSGQENELTFQKWPTFDELLIKADTMKLAVQINGKRRSEIEVDINTVEKEIFETAKSADKISNHLKNKIILKEIYVKGRLVNIVVK
ncbi:MAG: leucine--tRNA ligase [Candidatus Marinimicrobia bacterium]|nr:leucine--tRNA ligase [Candidatus Neomarinimicrobiota bacterium]MDP6611058.1 leucine--tRNA ligase [Candidatus Neomarinimicrobiota bacterium]